MAKVAVRKLKRLPNGTMGVIFVDAQTGEELTSTQGYEVRGSDPQDLSGIVGEEGSNSFSEETEEDVTTPPTSAQTVLDNKRILINGRPETETGVTPNAHVGNNFGYVDKPAALGLLGVLPGMLGLAGKTVNAIVQANNTQAVGKARSFLGLPERTGLDLAKGVMNDNEGYIGDITIGDEQYAVSFEATTPDGRTALTPNEARTRSLSLGKPIAEATEEQVEAAKADHATKGKTGFLSKLGLVSPLANIASTIASHEGWLGRVIEKAITGEEETEVETTPTVETTTGAPLGKVERSPLGPVATSGGSTVGIDDAIAPPSRTVTPGKGLENLSRAGTDLAGKGRNVTPDDTLMQVIQQATTQALGPGYKAVVSSGTYSPEVIQAINQARAEAIAEGKDPDAAGRAAGQIGTTRHTTGKAADFYVVDPQGKVVTSEEALEAVAGQLAQLGITGLGLGNPGGYMGGTTIHADVVDPSRATGWGGKGQGFKGMMSDSIGLPNAFTGNIPTPTPSPGPGGNSEEGGEGGKLSFSGVVDAIADGISGALGVSSAHAQGIRSEEDINRMAYTIAGELGSKTLAAIASGDPFAIQQARQEIAAIAGTIEKRARSSKFASLASPLSGVLTGSKYNSLSPSNAPITAENFSKFGGFITEAIEDFYSGKNPSPIPEATHYHAAWMDKKPAWAKHAIDGMTQVGEHVFGNIAVPGTNRSEFARGLPDTVAVPPSRPASFDFSVTPANQSLASSLTPAPVDPVSRSPLGPANFSSKNLTPAPIGKVSRSPLGPPSMAPVPNDPSKSISVSLVSPEEASKLGLADPLSRPAFRSLETTPALPASKTIGLGPMAVTVGIGQPMSPSMTAPDLSRTTGKTNPSFDASRSPGLGLSGFGPSKAGNTETGFNAGSFGGSASGIGTGFGSVGKSGTSSFSGSSGFSGPTGRGVSTTSVGPDAGISDIGSKGFFSGPSSVGSQSLGGATSESLGFGPSVSTPGVASFSGFSAGTLGKSPGVTGPATAATSFSYSPGFSKGLDKSEDSKETASAGGSGGEGAKVLCTYFYQIGRLSEELYDADSEYADLHISKDTQDGYKYWALPIVFFLKKKKRPILENFLFFFVHRWASEMGYRMGIVKHSNIVGRLMCTFGEPICGLIGKIRRAT